MSNFEEFWGRQKVSQKLKNGGTWASIWCPAGDLSCLRQYTRSGPGKGGSVQNESSYGTLQAKWMKAMESKKPASVGCTGVEKGKR